MNRLFEILRRKVLKLANPHFYTKRSVMLLLLQQFFRFILFLRTDKPPKVAIQEMAKLANKGKGKTALVLGNGPSLNRLIPKQAIQFFDDIFVVNGFHNLRISEEISPSFYCLSDPLDALEIDDEGSKEGNNLREYFKQNIDCVCLLPYSWISTAENLPNKSLYFDDRERTFFSRNISPLKPRAYSSVTLYKALAVACFMGYKKIYILGFDNTEFHNYIGRLDNESAFEHKTYATLKNEREYYSGNLTLPFVSGLAGRMQSYAHLFGDLFMFSKYPIINLDPHSLTDAFPKIATHPAIAINVL